MTDKFHVVHLSDIQRSGSIQENDKDTLKSVRKLLIKKENDIARADRIRKMQIRDINQHYQFELGRVEGDHCKTWHNYLTLHETSLSSFVSLPPYLLCSPIQR